MKVRTENDRVEKGATNPVCHLFFYGKKEHQGKMVPSGEAELIPGIREV